MTKPSYEEVMHAHLEPDEQVIHVQSTKNRQEAYVLTDRRFFRISYGKVYATIPLADIAEVSMGAVRVPGKPGDPFDPAFTLKVKGGDEPLYFHNPANWWDFASHDTDEMNAWPAMFPRKLCEVAGLKFAPVKLSRQPGGGWTLLYYWGLKQPSEMVWPQHCASCYGPLGDVKWEKFPLLSTTQQIPYCPACHKERFGFLRKDHAVKNPQSSMHQHIELWFENQKYAQEFADLNFA